MNEFTPADRQLIREYLLDTLDPAEHERVEARILESQEWQEALEAERAALGVLDELEDAEAPEDLAARTLTRVDEAAKSEKGPRRLFGSWTSIAVTLALVGVIGAILLPALTRAREAARRASTQNNMKQIGLVLKMYANESPGELYPPMSPYKSLWMFDIERVYPKFLSDLSILVDLERPDADEIADELGELARADSPDWERITELAALSFTYVGWAVTSTDDADLIAQSYAQLTPEQLDLDLGPSGQTVHRLREGIERFMITDINNPAASAMGQSELPIVVTNPASEHASANALFLDGHVESWSLADAASYMRWFLDAVPHFSRPD